MQNSSRSAALESFIWRCAIKDGLIERLLPLRVCSCMRYTRRLPTTQNSSRKYHIYAVKIRIYKQRMYDEKNNF